MLLAGMQTCNRQEACVLSRCVARARASQMALQKSRDAVMASLNAGSEVSLHSKFHIEVNSELSVKGVKRNS